MSLRRRFVLVLGAYGLALAAVLSLVSWKIARDALERELDRRLSDVAGAAAATGLPGGTAELLGQGSEEGSAWYWAFVARLGALRRYVDQAFIFRVDDLTVLAHSDSLPTGTPLYFLEPYRNDIAEAMLAGSATTGTFEWCAALEDAPAASADPCAGASDTRPYRWSFVQLDGTSAMLGVLLPADFLAPLERLGATLLWGAAGAALLAVLLGALLAGTVVTPIEQLSRVALRIQRGRLDRPVEVEREDEVGRLARAMERMRVGILERDYQLRLMLAQVAHELRNPLGGLELFASAAAEAEDPRERRRLIERVRSEVAALNHIIDDFLTFAKPLEPDYEEVDVRGAVRDAAELVEPELEAAGGELEVRLPADPLLARADRDQVKRAVLNLLRNAAESGRRVRVEARTAEPAELVIVVTDDGPGISPDIRDRIFDPFVSDKEKGAGLGLAIVKKVADAHGGRVEVRQASDPGFGRGAEFRLYLTGSVEPSVLVEPTSVG